VRNNSAAVDERGEAETRRAKIEKLEDEARTEGTIYKHMGNGKEDGSVNPNQEC
jgi:hypothetical protein